MAKFLYQPVSPFVLNQGFAYNIPCVEDVPNIPLDKRKVINGANNNTCAAGYVKLYPLLGMPKGHNGLDLRASHGQPVYASCEGSVQEIQTEEARGLGIGIVSNERYFCNETQTMERFKVRYWHLKSFNVQHEQVVKKGDLIGYADNTGFSSGDHLHFEIKPVQVLGNMKLLNLVQNNGFFGAVDPLQYMETTEVFNPNTPPVKYPNETIFEYNGRLFKWCYRKLFGKDF